MGNVNVTVLDGHTVKRNGKYHGPGKAFDIDEQDAKPLIEGGIIDLTKNIPVKPSLGPGDDDGAAKDKPGKEKK